MFRCSDWIFGCRKWWFLIRIWLVDIVQYYYSQRMPLVFFFLLELSLTSILMFNHVPVMKYGFCLLETSIFLIRIWLMNNMNFQFFIHRSIACLFIIPLSIDVHLSFKHVSALELRYSIARRTLFAQNSILMCFGFRQRNKTSPDETSTHILDQI